MHEKRLAAMRSGAALTGGGGVHIKNPYFLGKEETIIMSILKGKKAIVIGDRDGVPGPAIGECAISAGAEVVFSSTECFV